MKTFSKNMILAVLIIFLMAVTFAGFFSSVEEKETVTISKLVEQINNREVERIKILEDGIEITLKNGTIQTGKKEFDSSLSETLINYGADKSLMSPENLIIEVKGPSGFVLWSRALLPLLIPILFIVLFIWFMGRKVQQSNVQALGFGQSKARMIDPNNKKNRVTFKDVAGADEAKEELVEIVDFLKNPKKFVDIGARIPRGVLLMGAPGTGKTLLAKAVAGEAGVPFFQIAASEFVEMFVGVGASRVRDLFKQAKKASPSIIFIDEVDAVGRHRGAGLGGGHDEREQTLNQILVELDGFGTSDHVIVMAATNRPDVLDPALLRPGRFDRRVVIDLPDIKAREAILNIHARKKPLAKNVNLRKIAERTPGFSGADLANLLNEAAILAARHEKKEISDLDLISSIEKVLLGPERKSHILSNDEKKITAYHEAGHALVAASLTNADPVHKVSIVARGRAAGYTLKLPERDRSLYSKSHFIDELAVSLGGYAAESFVFKELTTGASNDLSQATNLARKLVTKYGMSEKVGPVTIGERDEMIFLGKEIASDKNYSEKTASLIDQEISVLMNNALKTASTILKSKKKILDEIAKYLIKHESLEREAFDKIVFGAKKATATA